MDDKMRMRPFVFINVAASLDGKISDEGRRQLRISCSEDLRIVDELRAKSDAIMVGIGTVLTDDPRLTVKSEELRRRRIKEGKDGNPIRVVVDSRCRVPVNSKVMNDEARTIVAVSKAADEARIREISDRAEVVVFGKDRVDLGELLRYLSSIGVERLMVEGGGTLISSLIANNLVDEMRIYYAPMVIGGSKSPTICDGNSKVVGCTIERIERVGEGFAVFVKF